MIETVTNAFRSLSVAAKTTLAISCTGLVFWIYKIFTPKPLPVSNDVKPFNQMPRPKGWRPFIGHSLLIKNPLHKTYQEWQEKHGEIFNCQMGSVNTVVLSCPILINEAFSKNEFCGKPPLSVTTEIMANKGIIHSEGALWKNQRIFVVTCLKDLGFVSTRTTSNRALEGKIEEQVKDLLQKIDEIRGEAHDYSDNIRTTIVNIVCQVLFGKVFSSAEDKVLIDRQIALQEEGPALVSISQWANYFPFLKRVPFLNRGYLKLCANKEEHHSFLSKVVDEHERVLEERLKAEARLKAEERLKAGYEHILESRSNHFVEAYLKEMKKMQETSQEHYFTKSQLLHCLADLFGAGTGTIVSNIMFGLLYLSNQEDVQMKAHEQLRQVVGAERNPTFDDIDKLPYIKAVVAEVQRIASIVPNGTPHGATKTGTLGGYSIPEKTMIISFFWGMNHNDAYFENHQQFLPERFIDEDRQYKEPAGFIPFSKGGRSCVGVTFARMTMYLTFAAILHRFKISYPDGDPDFSSAEGFILFPKPHRICLTPWPQENEEEDSHSPNDAPPALSESDPSGSATPDLDEMPPLED